MNEALKRIEPKKDYSLNQVVKLNLIPFIKSYPTVHKEVLRDLARPRKEQTLKATIIGEGRATAIWLKGANLQAYIKKNKARL